MSIKPPKITLENESDLVARTIQTQQGQTGACLSHSYEKGTTGCTCSLIVSASGFTNDSGNYTQVLSSSEITFNKCDGIFIPGVTCGPLTSSSGACCLYDTENNTSLPCQSATYCSCFSLAKSFNFKFVWSLFTKDRPSCKDFSCAYIQNKTGACCDGKGDCHESTEEMCISMNHFFQGSGTKCISNGVNICISGTGGCCDGATCNDGITGTDCLQSQKLYIGAGSKCYERSRNGIDLPCLSAGVSGSLLNIGDIVEDGVVVGVYIPGSSTCLGNPIFSGSSDFADLVDGTEITCSSYVSNYDYNGYGNISGSLCNTEDSFIMLVSLDSLIYKEVDTFTWSNGSMSYGPLLGPSGRIIETETENIFNVKEGYIIDSTLGLTKNENIITSESTSTCASRRNPKDTVIQRSYRNNHQNFNGRWSSDWGLINTIRVTNSELMYESGTTYDAYLYSSLYAPSENFDANSMTTMVQGLRILNSKTKSNHSNISSWYIPSINELGFLADQCKNNNLNGIILNNNGVPLNGEFWSSTGTFKYTGSTGEEGVYNGATAGYGSEAWSINFEKDNYTIKKDNRLSSKNIRPIKLIRCDNINMNDSRIFWKVNS